MLIVVVRFFESEDITVRFSTRSKVRLSLTFLAILALLGAVVATANLGRPATSAHAASPVATFHGQAGTVKLARSGQLSTATSQHSNSPASNHPRVPIVHNQGHKALSAARSGLPTTADTGTGSPPGLILHNFAGLNSVDSFNGNGFILEPPDQGLCVGTLLGQKVVAEVINDVAAFYSTDGTIIAGPTNLNVLFAEPPTEGMSDPRCVFDTSTQTFFFTALALAPTANSLPTHDDLLVLHSDDTTAVYRADTTFASNTTSQCPCFGDQPKIGIDQYNVYISTDEFGGPNQSLETSAAVIAFAKSDLLQGAPTAHTATYLDLTLNGIGVVGLQPAITIGKASEEFFLNSFPYLDEAQLQPNPSSTMLGLWALANPASIASGQTPTLSSTIITSETYAFPVPALSTNGSSLATYTNDSRMQQLEYIGGHLLSALDSAVNVANDPVTRDGAAWFELKPLVDANQNITGAKFVRQGYLAAAGEFLTYPAIVKAKNGRVGISFSITSQTLNPSTGYALLGPVGKQFTRLYITQTGSGPDIGFTCGLGAPQQCRWGDYSWATLDPDGTDMWMAAEDTVPQVATQPNTNPPAQTNWGTQVWDVNGNGWL